MSKIGLGPEAMIEAPPSPTTYVLQGELEAVVGFETLRLTEGDSLAFDPATPHHYYNRTAGTVRVLSVVVHDPAT